MTYESRNAVAAVMATSKRWKAHKATNPGHGQLPPRHPVTVATDKGRNVVGMADGATRSETVHAERRAEFKRYGTRRTRADHEERREPSRAESGETVSETMARAREELNEELRKRGVS